jgi:hypothetical protein
MPLVKIGVRSWSSSSEAPAARGTPLLVVRALVVGTNLR